MKCKNCGEIKSTSVKGYFPSKDENDDDDNPPNPIPTLYPDEFYDLVTKE